MTAMPLLAQDRATVDVAGEALALRAKATRDMFFGAVELYSVGIYAAQPMFGVQRLRDPKLTKAVRIEVLYDGGMPGNLPASWWDELVPALTAAQERNLRGAFAKLASGDDVWISYAPSVGTRLLHNGRLVVSTDGHELMNAVLDLWFGRTPVSEDLGGKLRDALRRAR